MGRPELCLLTGATRYEIDKWVVAGCPVVERPSDKGGEWRFDAAQVFAWRADQARAEAGGRKPPDLNAERARLAQAQADGQELKNRVSRGELIPVEEVASGWEAAIGRCRALLLGIPTQAEAIALLAREHGADAPAAIAAHLTKQVDTALAELQNTDLDDEEGDADLAA